MYTQVHTVACLIAFCQAEGYPYQFDVHISIYNTINMNTGTKVVICFTHAHNTTTQTKQQ